jgi:hypothetical protein
VDFGIAFDAPRYTLTRTSQSELEFTGELGLVGGYVYNDMTSNISLTTDTSNNTSVPEPANVLGMIFAGLATRFQLKKKSCI